MNQNIHEQARELIALDGVEDRSGGRRDWLRAHLQECADCRDYAEAAGSVARAIRSQPFAAGSDLVWATRMRVRARAAERRQQQERAWLVGLACLFVGLSASITTPLFWRSFEWMGLWAGVSSWVWQTAFMYFWIVPALVVSALLMARGAHLGSNGEKQWK
jgi:predicted anti-sigma-YlaC factor YlaD